MRAGYVIAILWFLVGVTSGLYEDQVGKFEWRQQYIGKAVLLQMDIISPVKKVIVATNQNVLAALSLKSGEILWRQILEQGKDGEVQLLDVDHELVTVSGSLSPVVRGWDLETGHALFEWPAGPVPATTNPRWLVVEDMLVLVQFPHGEAVAQWFNLRSGAALASKRVAVDVADPALCLTQGTRVVCLELDGLLSVVSAGNAGDLGVESTSIAEQVADVKSARLALVEGKLPLVAVVTPGRQWVVAIAPEMKVLTLQVSAHALVSSAPTDTQQLVVTTEVIKSVLEVRTLTTDGAEVAALRGSTPYPADTARPEAVCAACQARRDGSLACRLLLSALDHTLAVLQHPGGFLWARPEALASIVAVEIVDLPVSDTDAAIEKEFGNKNYGLLGIVARRLCSEWLQLQGLLLTVLGVALDQGQRSAGLVRDHFGLHKLIVAVTKPGKVFGIDNLSGEVVWSVLADIRPLGHASAPVYVIFPMRSPIHMPYPAQLAILCRSSTGTGALLVLNPITGHLAEPLLTLDYAVLQAVQLQTPSDDYLKAILLLDAQGRVHVYPPSARAVAKALAPSTFLYTVQPSNGQVDGYGLRVVDGEILAVRTWQQKLGQDDAHVVAVVGKRDTERVHSQGRVLGDRSVLYKYVNPNLVAIFTQGYHPAHKTVLNVYLVDAVSGLVVFSASHRRARDPVHAVHAENWLVYAYTNDKHRRTEVATLELYEGTTQLNATAFTSLAAPPLLPMVERQAFILPAHVLALKDTVTEQGITNKHIMVALSSGAVLELPWVYLDPRRTIVVTAEMREEGVVPYMPELPIPLEAIVNHNQTVAQVRAIHTAPSGIESTCLLFVYGLDILYTRVAPSKTFDLLKEDFDYFLIAAVLAALVVASFVTRKMASRKALKQAWK